MPIFLVMKCSQIEAERNAHANKHHLNQASSIHRCWNSSIAFCIQTHTHTNKFVGLGKRTGTKHSQKLFRSFYLQNSINEWNIKTNCLHRNIKQFNRQRDKWDLQSHLLIQFPRIFSPFIHSILHVKLHMHLTLQRNRAITITTENDQQREKKNAQTNKMVRVKL